MCWAQSTHAVPPPQGFTYSIANGICFGFISFAFMRTARWAYQKLALHLGPKIRANVKESFQKTLTPVPFDESVDCTLPHPLMLLMASFAAVRFAYLAPGHQ